MGENVRSLIRGSSGAAPAPTADPRKAIIQESEFLWAVGIESSSLPHLGVDQFQWTQHNRNWRDDIRLVRDELGLKYLRYSIPWHYMEPRRGQFVWKLADERIDYCRDLGIELILDVMHFGTPLWLQQAVGDPEFPEALEDLTGAMVRRYRSQVSIWCPVNEPLVTALFSGDFGFWPPHARKWRGYFPVLARVALATSRAVRAIRAAQPEAVVLICDAADHFKTHEESLRDEVTLRNLRRFLLLDLIAGRVDVNHPLHEWCSAYGMTELDLQWFRTHPQMPDLIGLDYYSHSDWQLDRDARGNLRQRRADAPAGLYGVANDYYNRYSLPMLVTETSIEGKPINREIWLERMVEDCRRLRHEGVPLLGLTWWPLLDHLDWDGALTHRIGKLHQVGLFKLVRQANGLLGRVRTSLAGSFAKLANQRNQAVGELGTVAVPLPDQEEQLPPLGDWLASMKPNDQPVSKLAGIVPRRASSAVNAPASDTKPAGGNGQSAHADTATGYGIVVFSHLRWGFVWQRPQQFLSRFARKHPVLFVEEPMFDLAADSEPRVELHQVMPGVTVSCIHAPDIWQRKSELPDLLRQMTRRAIEMLNETRAFDRPLLWYYSPMDAFWSLGHFPARGIVYDCMDELSQFSGAPEQLVDCERWLMKHADVVFAGGYNLWEKKSQQHANAHFFACGVEADHFALAMDPDSTIPPDIDFMARPILGWFGVVDERVDYNLVGEMARLRPDWSFAMVGPVVKMDPNLLPHAPNLYWMGGRDYSILPNYCKAFDLCMMCFALNKATEYINPTKALEYLATARPVISTPVKDVVRQYQGLIDIAATPQEFIAAAERALNSPDRQRIERGLELARQSTWEATVDKMQALIATGIAPEDRRSNRRIEPMANVNLIYQFVRTPGS